MIANNMKKADKKTKKSMDKKIDAYFACIFIVI